jgi:hypothetical protein
MRALLAVIIALALVALPARAINLLPSASRNITATNASPGVATFNTDAAVITSASLSTAAGAQATFQFYSPAIQAPPGGGPQSLVFVSVSNGTNSAGSPDLYTVTVTNGLATVVVDNAHATNAFNGTLIFSVIVFN